MSETKEKLFSLSSLLLLVSWLLHQAGSCLLVQDWVLEPGAVSTYSRSPPKHCRDCGTPRALGLW